MQNRNRGVSMVTVAIVVVALVLIAVPWVINLLYSPLQPPILGLTPTAYSTIAAEYNTRQAATDRARPSVLSTQAQPTDPPIVNSTATLPPATPLAFGAPVDQDVLYVVRPRSLLNQASPPSDTPQPTATSPDAGAPSPTATIKLPQIYTATPLPPVDQHVELTDDEASVAAQQAITTIQDLHVHFLQDSLQITGTVPVVGPLNVTVSVGIEINGTLALDNGKLVMHVTSILANGAEQNDDAQRQQAEASVNDWLTSYLLQEQVVSYQVVPGRLILDVLQFSTSQMPTLPPTLTPSPTPTITTCLPLTPIVIGTLSSPSATEIALPPDTSASPCPAMMIVLPEVTEIGDNYTLPTVVPPAPTNADGSVTLSGEQATALSAGTLGPLHNVQISFTPSGGITISGELDLSAAANSLIPLGVDFGAIPVVVTGRISVVDGRPRLTDASISVANQSAVQIKGDAIFQAVDTWLSALLPGSIGAISTDSGVLSVTP